MEAQLLGPFEVHHEGTSILPNADKPRQVLAMLALNANTVVPLRLLIEELWGDQPPRSTATTLQTYVMQLRRKIGLAGCSREPLVPKNVLVTHHGGYLLAIPPESVDVLRFEQLVAAARAATPHDAATASDRYRAALALWRGPALVDVPVGRALAPDMVRLEEAWIGAIEGKNAVDLRLGRHAELLSSLASLTARHPMHENLHAQFIIALHRSGRTYDALLTYQRLRSTMVEELGLEPSPRMRRLHQAVLSASPDLELAVGTGSPEFELIP
ncbi:AfsR/SARP family transcriptional regulator [Micromonospora sp. WMMD998]|uniref:AfsR/SARP family transcriptional regulator n=1 Tax=Micromonospora sp. WMMD998 TaxID=3016092 RepID=UPI00249B218C|nr:AfsR/SARP family transcriptional regulator [Micromonospora sp. WMMD998]WFE41130.1 AfsR/SARP family transcriptional regulator [Micromonospora sp. WMMD998]